MTSSVTGSGAIPDRPVVQRRTLRVLVGSQMLGGIGVSSGIAVGGLLARSLLDSDTLAGFAQASVTIGAAIAAIPLARIMAARGRRPGLSAGYAGAVAGALVALLGARLHVFAVLVLGMLIFGAATAANLQARYAAADLAEPAHRARALAVVVWATTVGVVLGPNLAGPVDDLGQRAGLPPYGGPFVLSAAAFALAALVVTGLLRPDPLVLAGGTGRAGRSTAGAGQALRVVMTIPAARLGLTAMTLGQIVMVAVMTMTPLQMRHAGQGLRLVGFVISVHVLGMYAFSPVMGWAADRFGRRPLIGGGAVLLLASTAVAGTAAVGGTLALSVGLLLLGLGWNATLVGGSTMLVDAVPAQRRAAAQGAADMVMSGTGGLGGALSGLVMTAIGYGGLNLLGALLTVGLVAALAVTRTPGRRPRARVDVESGR